MKKKIQKHLQNKNDLQSKNENNKCFSWVTAVRVLYLAGSHSPPHLPRMPSNTVLISGPAVGPDQILIWSYSCVFLPPMSTAIRASVFSLWELSMTFYIFHRHRVCLVECVDLICSLYSCWEGLSLFRQPQCPWFLLVVLFPPLHVSWPLGIAPKAALEDLGLPLWGPGVEVVQLLGLQGFWQHQVLRVIGG